MQATRESASRLQNCSTHNRFAVNKGIIHKNKAARGKSRLNSKVKLSLDTCSIYLVKRPDSLSYGLFVAQEKLLHYL